MQTEKLFKLFSKIDIPIETVASTLSMSPSNVDPLTLIVIPASKLEPLRDRFRREADALYLEAKRSIVATTARIPSWMIVVMFLLGWNELIAVLSNPTYFIMLGLMGGGKMKKIVNFFFSFFSLLLILV